MTVPARAINRRFGARTAESRGWILLRRWIIALVCVHVALAIISGYRAIVQVYSLDLRIPGTPLQAGSVVGFRVTTSARTHVTVRLVIEQGGRVDTIARRVVPANWDAAYMPVPRRDSVFVALSPETLARFKPGPATIRATATGLSQWLRVPPPTIREQLIELSATGA